MYYPIVLFVYNRPFHTKKVLDSLAQNIESKFSDIYIFLDGLKQFDENSLNTRNELTDIINSESRFQNKYVIESNVNKGLAKSVIEGVSYVLEKKEAVIVLEDDIIVSKFFLKYMNDALKLYQSSKKVMHVSGYSLPFHNNNNQGTYFYHSCSCWGWGTWNDSWKYFEKNPSKQIDILTKKSLWQEFTLDETQNGLKEVLYQNLNEDIDTWAVFWTVSVFLNKGTALHPKISFTQNIGFDGSGIHCGDWQEDNPFISGGIYDKSFRLKRKFCFNNKKEIKAIKYYLKFGRIYSNRTNSFIERIFNRFWRF